MFLAPLCPISGLRCCFYGTCGSALADCLGSGGDAFAFRTITGYSRLTHCLLKNMGRYARPWMSLRRSITPPLRFKTEMKKKGMSYQIC